VGTRERAVHRRPRAAWFAFANATCLPYCQRPKSVNIPLP